MSKPKCIFNKIRCSAESGRAEKTIGELFEKSGAPEFFSSKELVAVKTHFGEKGGSAFVAPKYIKVIIDQLKKKKPNLS